jgi:hypothetical protein
VRYPDAVLSVGDKLGFYEITGVLGAGGMGQVLRANHVLLAHEVALKVLLPGPIDRDLATARFVREAKLAATLEHPNTVRVLDFGNLDGTLYLVMELVRGQPMSEHLGSRAVTIARRLNWLVQAARGLHAVHEAGIVHRDFKPANVMITAKDVVKVVDFGLAKRVSVQGTQAGFHTQMGFVVGTPAYMAPEQLAGADVDARADQFAWGLTGFALITGTRLHADDERVRVPAFIARRLEELVPAKVADVIGRAMRISRDERFPSMSQAADELERASALVSTERVKAVYCPRCASPLDDARLCARCDGPSAKTAETRVERPLQPQPRVIVRSTTRRSEANRWRFSCVPQKANIMAAAITSDGARVTLFSGARRSFDLVLDKWRERTLPARLEVSCAAFSPTGVLWAASQNMIAYANGEHWTWFPPLDHRADLIQFAAASQSGAFFGGFRPGGGMVYAVSRDGLVRRVELPGVVRGLALANDGTAVGISGTKLFRTDGVSVDLIETNMPLRAVCSVGPTLFAVGAGGHAMRYDGAVALEPCQTTHDLMAVAGTSAFVVAAADGRILLRNPATATWEVMSHGRWDAETWPRAHDPMALWCSESDLVLVLRTGTVVRGTRV